MDNLSHTVLWEQLLQKSFYLVNLDRVQIYQEGNERFIFFTDEWFFDVFMETTTKEICELSWISKEDFLPILERTFPARNFTEYLRPYQDIPAFLLTACPQLRTRVLGVMQALTDPLQCWQLKKKHDPQSNAFLLKHITHGWYTIVLDQSDCIRFMLPATEANVKKEIVETLRAFEKEPVKLAPKALIDKCTQIWAEVDTVLMRLEQGELWQEYTDGFSEGFYIQSVNGYFYISTQDAAIDTVAWHKESAVIEAVLSAVLKKTKHVFNALSREQLDTIDKIINTTLYPALLKKGKITIGGGFTTDMQWVITCQEGHYYRSQAAACEELSEQQVKDILANKQFGWARMSE